MRSVIAAMASILMAAAPAFADDKADVMAPVHRFFEVLNKQDMKAVPATCSDVTAIVDNFPPHEWHGPGACATWAAELDVFLKQSAITDGIVTLGKPLTIDVTADRAYVVVPAGFRYKAKGKSARLSAQFTAALQKGAAGWHMTGWAWADQ